MRIEICGGIASGKTTLAKLLEENMVGKVIYENFRINPFWKAFYENPSKYTFETEIAFTLQHYHEIKKNSDQDILITDYSFYLDLAYAKLGLQDKKLKIYLDLLEEIYNDISSENLLIYLNCNSSIELSRIKRRNRDVEQNIEVGFLEMLNIELMEVIKNIDFIQIDSNEYDFANNLLDKENVLNKIKKALNK